MAAEGLSLNVPPHFRAMRLIISRKGFDSTSGGAPSAIVRGVPVSLPIPATSKSDTTFEAIGLGDAVESATAGRISRSALCHDDPLFADGHCWFGQSGTAQSHLANQGVGPGDVFLFFGLFAEPGTNERHHRFYGYMRVLCCGAPDVVSTSELWRDPPRPHPHLAGYERKNDAVYFGTGRTAQTAPPALRLTRPGGPLTTWRVPHWLRKHKLSYHGRTDRWLSGHELEAVKRGQEFVSDIGSAEEPRRWVEEMIALIEAAPDSPIDDATDNEDDGDAAVAADD